MKTVPYNDLLHEQLRDPEQAAAYLTACLEDSEEVFLLGLRHVAEAWGGVGKLAQESELNRESLYRMLSDSGNPRFSSLGMILSVLGLRLKIEPQPHEKKVA